MKTIYIVLIIAALAILQSCDKIEGSYTENEAFIWNERKIIVYDFTGHKCGNCPRAHETISELVDTYGDAVIPIAIHATYYAVPQTDDTTQPYHYDFRTDVGDFLGGRYPETGFYGDLFLPAGLVNSIAAENFSAHDTWSTKVAEVISTYPEFLVDIEPIFNAVDSTISCDIDITTNISNSRNISLVAFILEDHILQWQTDYDDATPTDIEGYEHNHVLRAGMNGAFGEVIKDNNESTAIGDLLSESYSQKAGNDWVIDNCLIVAFVYDNDTKEILQAEMIHLNE